MKECDNCKMTDRGEGARMVYPVVLCASVTCDDDEYEIALWEGELCEDCAPKIDAGYPTRGPVPEVLTALRNV